MTGASDHISFHAAFEFSRTLPDGAHRRAMNRAGYAQGAVMIACHPDESIGEVLRRVDQVEGDRPVFVAVRNGDGWAMVTIPRPVRTNTQT